MPSLTRPGPSSTAASTDSCGSASTVPPTSTALPSFGTTLTCTIASAPKRERGCSASIAGTSSSVWPVATVVVVCFGISTRLSWIVCFSPAAILSDFDALW